MRDIEIDLDSLMFWLIIGAALILFSGDPDLHDRMIYGELTYECPNPELLEADNDQG